MKENCKKNLSKLNIVKSENEIKKIMSWTDFKKN